MINLTFAVLATLSFHCGQSDPTDRAMPATYTQVPGFPTTNASASRTDVVFQIENTSGSAWSAYVPPSGTGYTIQRVAGSPDTECPWNTGFTPLSEHYNYYHATELAATNVPAGQTYYAELTYSRESNQDSWFYSSAEELSGDSELLVPARNETLAGLPTRNRTRTWDTGDVFTGTAR